MTLTVRLAIGVAFVGIGYGTESDLVSYLTSKYFGRKHFGAIYGCLIILFLSGVSIGPLMYGTARSMFGSYGHDLLQVSQIIGPVLTTQISIAQAVSRQASQLRSRAAQLIRETVQEILADELAADADDIR